jgi:4-hydroxy-3-polyprenylbenzoate decarboxylase
MPKSAVRAGDDLDSTPAWHDLREWMEQADRIGELRTVRGASWQDDIGNVTALLDSVEGSPAVVFDEIPEYQKGYRVLVNANGSKRRQCLTLGIEPAGDLDSALLDFWRGVLVDLQPIPPRVINSAPFFENSLEGDRVDLASFPAPRWHPGDGGRYLATANLTLLRDPETGVVNAGTYRGQILGPAELGIYCSPGHHGRLIIDKYAKRQEPCPVVSVVGVDPLLFVASCAEGIAFGQSELDWAAGIRKSAIDVVLGPKTGLPIPASSEIVLEGWIDPSELRDEGPYGEWHGYYSASGGRSQVIKVEAIYHRDEPIITGCPQGRPPHEDNYFLAYLKSVLAETQLAAAGVPNVQAVWCPPEFGNRLMTIVSIEQKYPGHAMQAGLVAGQLGSTAYGGRFVVIVDEDIDVHDLQAVRWAVATRMDPQRDAHVITRSWSSSLDTAIAPGSHSLNSRLILDATRPWEQRSDFPTPIARQSPEAIRHKWQWLFEVPDGRSDSSSNHSAHGGAS